MAHLVYKTLATINTARVGPSLVSSIPLIVCYSIDVSTRQEKSSFLHALRGSVQPFNRLHQGICQYMEVVKRVTGPGASKAYPQSNHKSDFPRYGPKFLSGDRKDRPSIQNVCDHVW